jgi:hypothetical protein
VRIEVKQRHIDAGQPFSPSICPIALAIKEHSRVPEAAWCQVGSIEATLWMGAVRVGSYELSHHAQNFVHDFDAGFLVSPATFMLTEVKVERE